MYQNKSLIFVTIQLDHLTESLPPRLRHGSCTRTVGLASYCTNECRALSRMRVGAPAVEYECGMYGPVRYSRTSYMYTVARWVDWPTRSSYCVAISTEALRVYM
jgi:hypothetical protein